MINKNSEEEKLAVKKFLDNEKIKFDESLIIIPNQDDYVDIIYDGDRYQITVAPAGYPEVIGKLRKNEKVVSKQNNNIEGEKEIIEDSKADVITYEYNTNDTWKDFITDPISNKRKQYRKIPNTAKLILLIYCKLNPVYEYLKEFKIAISQSPDHQYYQYLKQLGFEFIYLVLSNKNFLLFP